jgi:hypothetical protein
MHTDTNKKTDADGQEKTTNATYLKLSQFQKA